MLRNSSRRKQSGQEKEAKPTSAGRARFQFPGPSIHPSEYPSQSAPISLAREVPSLFIRRLSFSLSQETPHGSTSFSPSRSFWPRLSSAPIGPSTAPLVPRGMLRTSIILPDPASFTDTSQEQMNASHFDGFMNTLGEDGARGVRCFRRDPPSTSYGSTLFSPPSSGSWHRDGVALMEPVA